MRQPPSPAPLPERRAGDLRGGIFLLGIVLAANLLDLVCRCSALGPATTTHEKILLALQAGVCGVLLVLMLLAAFCLGARPRATPTLLPLPYRYEPTKPMTVELN